MLFFFSYIYGDHFFGIYKAFWGHISALYSQNAFIPKKKMEE